MKMAQTCVTISKGIGITKLHLECLVAQGLTVKRTNLEDAKTLFLQAQSMAASYKDYIFQAIIYNELGDVCLDLNITDDAVSHFRNAVSKARAINSLSQQARALYGLSRCYDEANRKSFALKINYVTDLLKLVKTGVEGYSDLVPKLE